jgi:oligopeptide transport system permease protein
MTFGQVAYITRLMRSNMLETMRQDFIRTERSKGILEIAVITKYALKNSILPVITYVGPMVAALMTGTFLIPSAIFEEAFLSFLRIGIQVPKASWGTMCNDAIQYLTQQPWLMIFPALAISITIFAFNFIGDGLRDALDPRINK